MFKNNLNKLVERMKESNIDLAVITDDDSFIILLDTMTFFTWILIVQQSFLFQKMVQVL